MPTSVSPRDWIDYVSALTPSLVAVFVAYVAFRQWRVARQKLRLDLYNKRFAIFEITLRFYQELLGGSTLDHRELDALHRQFITAMIESKFLFAPQSGVNQLLDEFNRAAFVIKGSRDILSNSEINVPPELRASTSSKLLEEQQALPSKLDALQAAVAPYLTFKGLVE